MTKLLDSLAVRSIRGQLGLSREALSEILDVSPDAIKKWEAGDRPCKGPAAILLRLLESIPQAVELLDGEPRSRLPNPLALKHSPEWFRLQRLLGAIEYFGRGVAGFTAVVAEEQLTVQWMSELEEQELLRRHRKNHELRETTSIAHTKFELDLWLYVIQSQRFQDSLEIPPLNAAVLNECRACKDAGLPPEQATERLRFGRIAFVPGTRVLLAETIKLRGGAIVAVGPGVNAVVRRGPDSEGWVLVDLLDVSDLTVFPPATASQEIHTSDLQLDP